MAKASTASKKTTPAGKVPAKTTTGKAVAKSNVDAALLREQVSGQGVSTDAADNIVPLVYTVQAQSKVCLKQRPEYVKGATAGMFWPRGSKELWDGEEEGVRVVPVHYNSVWLEWMPDRGGFAGRHDKRPTEAVQQEDPKDPTRKFWVMPNGNTVNESREYSVIVIDKGEEPIPAVFSFTGSDITSARAWMSSLNRKRTPKGAKASLYEYVWVLKTMPKTNDKGDWFGKYAEDIDERTPDDIFVIAHETAKSFGTGALKAGDYEVDSNAASEADGDDEGI